MVQLGKCLIASLPPFLLLEMYFYLIGQSAPIRVNPTALKIAAFVLVLVASNTGQLLILGRDGAGRLARVVTVNSIIWFWFFLLVGIDSVTIHRGLAKDMERTLTNFLAALGVNLAMFGVPLGLLNLCVAKVAARLWH